MNYDLNKLINPENKLDLEQLSTIVFNNVVEYSFNDNFEYMKMSLDYFSQCSLPEFYDSDAGYTYHTEEDIEKFMKNVLLFNDMMNEESRKEYLPKVDKLINNLLQFSPYRDIIKKIIDDEHFSEIKILLRNFDLKFITTNMFEQTLLIREIGRNYSELYNETKNLDSVPEYVALFKKYPAKNFMKESDYKALWLSEKYIDFFVKFPLEFEKTRLINNQPPEILFDPLKNWTNISKLKKAHLVLIESREKNSYFYQFKTNMLNDIEIMSRDACISLITNMLVNENYWNDFSINTNMFSSGLDGLFKNLDRKHKTNEFSNIPIILLKEKFDVALSLKSAKASPKI